MGLSLTLCTLQVYILTYLVVVNKYECTIDQELTDAAA